MQDGSLFSVTGSHCVLACFNCIIPYICPSLPEKQKEALSYLVKRPIIYSRVALRNSLAFQKLGIHQIVAPGAYHTYTALDFPVSMGKYQFPSDPNDPAVLFMLRVPCKPGLSQREQSRAGRAELLQTPFATFERNIRDQLQRMLGGAGFNATKDIQAITVNRWAHGYAFAGNALFDPDWKEGEQPWVVGRKPFGRITIANSDAEARAFMDAAIDQAHRAVLELGKA
jgi:spermidine dehydrogenase